MTSILRQKEWMSEAFALRSEGMKYSAIAHLLGVKLKAVQRSCANVKVRQKPVPGWYFEAVGMRDKGMTFSQIAEHFDVSSEAARRAVVKARAAA